MGLYDVLGYQHSRKIFITVGVLQMNDKDQVFAYFYRSRPPGLFVQPDGFNPDTRKTYSPRKEVANEFGVCLRAHGRVEYGQALTPAEVYQFELFPEDSVQWALYKAWEQVKAAGGLYVYMAYAGELEYPLEEPRDPDLDDILESKIVKVLLDAGINLNEIELAFQNDLLNL